MKYTEILEELKKRGASKILPFTPFADWHEDKEDNGFVVLPDGFPVDYLDPIYQSIDTKPIGGLTYEGYAWIDEKGNVGKSRLDLDTRATPQYEPEELHALQEIKDLLKGLEGARYLVKQLKQLEMDLNNPLDKQE